jgi:hypothetical protein
MTEEDLINVLARILSERLRDAPAPPSNSLRKVVNRAIRGVRKLLWKMPDQPAVVPGPWQWKIVARIRTLPEHMQEPLRLHYVFREAEESICLSIKTTPRELRRFLREATDYILMRRELMPEIPWFQFHHRLPVNETDREQRLRSR